MGPQPADQPEDSTHTGQAGCVNPFQDTTEDRQATSEHPARVDRGEKFAGRAQHGPELPHAGLQVPRGAPGIGDEHAATELCRPLGEPLPAVEPPLPLGPGRDQALNGIERVVPARPGGLEARPGATPVPDGLGRDPELPRDRLRLAAPEELVQQPVACLGGRRRPTPLSLAGLGPSGVPPMAGRSRFARPLVLRRRTAGGLLWTFFPLPLPLAGLATLTVWGSGRVRMTSCCIWAPFGSITGT